MCSGVTAYGALKRLVDRPRQRNLLLIGLGGVGMMGLSFAQAMFKQPITVADLSPAARETALKNGAAVAYDPAEPEIVRRILKETEGGFDGVVDFAGNEKSMAFAVATVARGGKIVVSGLMGGNFSLPMVQWVYKRMTIEGFMVGTLGEAKELMALARAGKIKPTPMKEEPMADVQKWIDELRAGRVVGRQQQEPQPGQGAAQSAAHVRAARQRQVEDGDVGAQGRRAGQPLGGGRGLADDDQAGIVAQHAGQTPAEDLIRGQQEDPHRPGRCHPHLPRLSASRGGARVGPGDAAQEGLPARAVPLPQAGSSRAA
jgi:hypothetical protein